MLNAMRHWAVHTKLVKVLDEGRLENTEIADSLFNQKTGLDPWFESDSSIWLIHWELVTQEHLITYYWLFNKNNKPQLDRDTFARAIKQHLDEQDIKHPSDLTLKRDIECFIRNYTHRKSAKTNALTEESVEGPLVELGLINRIENDAIELVRGPKPNLSEKAFLYFLMRFWSEAFPSARTLSLEAATYDEKSPGRVFLLDENSIIDYAERIALLDIDIKWSETAGVRQFSTNRDPQKLVKDSMAIFRNSYKNRASAK